MASKLKFYNTKLVFLSSAILLLLFISLPTFSAEELGWKLDIATASKNSVFSVNVPENGCLSIISIIKGKNKFERLWGPTLVQSGKQKIIIPGTQIASKSGRIELFSIDFKFYSSVGKPGRGERQFMKPCGIGWDPIMKNLYVADTGNDRIVRLDPQGRFLAQYGGFGVAFGDTSEEKEDSLDEPWDVAPGGFSNFYISDQNNNRIAEFDAYKSFKGNLFPKTNDFQNRLNRPKGLIVDSENNLWIADTRADRVLKISPSGEKILELGGFGWSQWKFKEPTQVAVDFDGRVFVADKGNKRIQIFDRLGSRIGEISDGLKSPVGVAIDPEGLIYVCDDETNELLVFSSDGKILSRLSGISKDDPFAGPCDVIALESVLYVLDSRNHRVAIFTKEKKIISQDWRGPLFKDK
ncbi:MAG: NHL repeat-containing protein [Candidatus Riflebacteria bacterium]|nr:NHL repeat-containing protein [Candidatus Riflebacteria bacterium]